MYKLEVSDSFNKSKFPLAAWGDDLAQCRILTQQLQERLDSLLEGNDQKVLRIAHDLRTPLGAILGFCELMLEPGPTDDEKKDYLQTILRNANTLQTMIEELSKPLIANV